MRAGERAREEVSASSKYFEGDVLHSGRVFD